MIDPITLLEVAYGMGGSEQEWLSRLTEAARASLGSAPDISGWTYDASGDDLHSIRETATAGSDSRFVSENSKFDSELPHSVRKKISRIYRTGFVGNLLRAPEVLASAGVGPEQVGHFRAALTGFLQTWKLADALWVNAQDPTYIGCLLVAPLSQKRTLRPREIHQWRCAAAHIAAAFRIRRRLADWPAAASPGAPAPEAILSPEGKLEHAEPTASGEPARAALRRAVVSIGRARGSLRRHDPEEAVFIWQALVAGRWSLVDHVDSDGRRFVLAHRNDATVPDQRGLTLRERQVLAHAALGHSNKVIAYELGLSTSTVAGHLAHARAKASLPSLAAMRAVAGATGAAKRPTK